MKKKLLYIAAACLLMPAMPATGQDSLQYERDITLSEAIALLKEKLNG